MIGCFIIGHYVLNVTSVQNVEVTAKNVLLTGLHRIRYTRADDLPCLEEYSKLLSPWRLMLVSTSYLENIFNQSECLKIVWLKINANFL